MSDVLISEATVINQIIVQQKRVNSNSIPTKYFDLCAYISDSFSFESNIKMITISFLYIT